ncbi:aspartate carbamoyltransferase regulatory subunit [Bifidobacterium magnum]|uniref:Aspartate carbamoyltransferase regulatory subunit n=1 Tax=Bifidobacterium magnum TaxID=1692 RepID=A0A087B9Z1_9BIFI|nr:aspartate carbamoyltransferase regulatory subunit [Bifidobacterium magnum]KFI67841.1 Aspartate carbamoyltransferase regulatory subunit [Bifidobacterium magnum]
MEVSSIRNGVIIDHVPAGTALEVLAYLDIDPASTRLALVMNAPSTRYGTKDIIKMEGDVPVDLEALAIVAPRATVAIVENGVITGKHAPTLPDRVVNVIRCVNPRCVTGSERGLDHVFYRVPGRHAFRCEYCDEEALR